jgi:hypothetical protein
MLSSMSKSKSNLLIISYNDVSFYHLCLLCSGCFVNVLLLVLRQFMSNFIYYCAPLNASSVIMFS